MSTQSESPPLKGQVSESRLSRAAGALVMGMARHWLALFNTAWAVYVLLPIMAPILSWLGLHAPAQVIYGVYSLFCHQLPDHSYFLFGPDPVPLGPALEAGGMPPDLNLFQQRRFLGSPELGYKVAICQRDMAIYGSIFLAGIVYGLLRRRIRIRPLSLKIYAVFLIPMAVDGLAQLVGLHESNWWLRTGTGALFGFASVWLLYPHVDDAMQDVIAGENARRQNR